MIRHPSENFMKYLMTCNHPQSGQDAWVATTLTSLGFPLPQQDYVQWLRADVETKKPVNFQPTNRYHRESVRFMRSEGIYGLHNPDKPAREAHLLVVDLRARPIVENLLLGRMEPKEIAKKVNSRLGTFQTGEGIDAYQHYYWNVLKLTVEDWSQLLQDYEVQRQNTLAILQVGPSLALHKMGFGQAIDSKTILHDMLEGIYFDFREWKTKPHGPERTKAMVAGARAASFLDMQLSQADSMLKDSLKAFETFRMKHTAKGVKDVRELAPDGNFTNSGAKLLEAGEGNEQP